MKRGTHPGNEPFNIHIHIDGLPADVNRTLNMLAMTRGVTKVVIVREALIEYAKRHAVEVGRALVQEGAPS